MTLLHLLNSIIIQTTKLFEIKYIYNYYYYINVLLKIINII